MKGGKIVSTIVDYFLILSAIIGVGFASGKEIYEFFYVFNGASLMGVLAFALLYVYLFFVVDYINFKLKINSYSQFNAVIFGRLTKITNVFLLINFAVTCAGMLAGADYLFLTFFNVGYKIPSIIISIIGFIILLGGIGKIKSVANIIIPFMIAAIVINSLVNINPQNVSMKISIGSSFMAVYYGILFGVNNFVTALPVMFDTKQKKAGRIIVILSIAVIILLNIFVLASNNFKTDMPMFEASANVSPWFYYVYFGTLILALFSTYLICSYNIHNIICKGKKSVFVAVVILLFNLIASNLGYGFIVKYLYVASSIISGIYIVVLIVMITLKLITCKKDDSLKEIKIDKTDALTNNINENKVEIEQNKPTDKTTNN